MPDAHANFAVSTVATAPSPATSGLSLIVASGEGSRFAAVPTNAVIAPAGAQATPANAEIVRVTGRSTDTLTIVRGPSLPAPDTTAARTVLVGDRIYTGPTAKTLDDIESLHGTVVTDYPYNADNTGATNTIAAVQAAIDATFDSAALDSIVYFPPGIYKITGTLIIPSNTILRGAGANHAGTRVLITSDATVLDFRGGKTAGSSKTHTRIKVEGIQFYRNTDFTSSAYVIDMTGDSSMCEVGSCSFGDSITTGGMNGINADGSAHWFHHCRFLHIWSDATGGGANALSAGDGAGIKMADTSGSTPSITIEECQFERTSKLLLTNARGIHMRNLHMETSAIEMVNTTDCTLEDSYIITSTISADNKSNDNRFVNISGRGNRVVNFGSNRFERVDAQGIARQVHSYGPFDASTSPILPTRVGTVYSSNPQVAYGTAGDVVLFAVKLMAPKNQSSNASTVVFKSTSGGTTLHTSPSITLTSRLTTGATPRDTDTFVESYTYWVMLAVPSAAQIYIETTHRHSVWCSKAINSNPLLSSTNDWGGTPTSGYFTNQTNATATYTSSMYRVNFTASLGWSIRQLFPWPNPVPRVLLFVLKGRWGTTQGMQLSELADAHDGTDSSRALSRYVAGDEAFNVQTTDKMLFLVTDMWNPTSSGAYGMAFGGYTAFMPSNTEIELDWAAVVPLVN